MAGCDAGFEIGRGGFDAFAESGLVADSYNFYLNLTELPGPREEA